MYLPRLPTKGQGKAEETDVEAKKGVDSAATYSLQKWQVKISHQQVNQNTASKPPPQYLYKMCAYFDLAVEMLDLWPSCLR
jgi:hypothetical protein